MNGLELPGDACSSDVVGGCEAIGTSRLFRLWIASYDNWRPARWNDTPPAATAVELIEDSNFSEGEARLFLEGFNAQMLTCNKQLWAVAVPIVLRCEGDSRPGELIRGYAFADAKSNLEI